MRRLVDLGYEAFDWPDEIPVLDHGRNEHRWAVVVEGQRETMEAAMTMLRKVCNRAYKLPRAMRFRSPGMYVIGVVRTPEASLVKWVQSSSTSTWRGGEVYHHVLVDPDSRLVVFPQQVGSVGRMRHTMYRPDELGARLLP